MSNTIEQALFCRLAGTAPGYSLGMLSALKPWFPLLSCVLFAACTTGDELNADAGKRADSGAYGRPVMTCQPAQAAAPVALDAQELSSNGLTTWLWTDDSVVAVGPGQKGRGYQISRFTSAGELLGQSWTAFPDATTQEGIRIAAVGGVLALAEQADELVPGAGNVRRSCRVGLVRLQDQSELQAPTRVSDPTTDESVLNETGFCEVTATRSSFVVAWQQNTSPTSDAASLFAQRIGLDGTTQGDRITLLADTISKQASVASASDEARAVIVFRGADQAEASVAFIDQDSVTMQALPGVSEPFRTLARAHDGFLLRTSSKLYGLDREGRPTGEPYELELSALAATLGDGYVAIKHEEYLVARSIDSALSQTSAPLGISDDRSADADALVFAPAGDNTLLVYRDTSGLKLLRLGCGTKLDPLGPKACQHEADLQPLDPGCSGPICHVSIRFDYLTLGVRGWSVSAGPKQPVDAAQATRAAQEVFAANSEYISNPPETTGPEVGLYTVYAGPSDFGGFALVGEQSGIVVAAGGIVWGGRGKYWTPTAWQPASDIRCSDSQVSTVQQVLDDSVCSSDGPKGATASQAMNVALSTNLARAFAAQGQLNARAYLYLPSTGSCISGDAEWLVVLTRQ